ncbi:carbon-nitrogen hydrolase [Rhexocercosporidium sp. MPI-PUGE-AT-0058]|nr:carbon-nitrogen hydrolase [Rhexocercosporidium sp. MPI-PUGE-AT-0058]
MDFFSNPNRILESIKQAKAAGASMRIDPELEITRYGCLDRVEALSGIFLSRKRLMFFRFVESETCLHSWESLSEIIQDSVCEDILIDISMPIKHRNVLYNCRVLFHNKKILLIRPKMSLANDVNYYEMRYFSPRKGERIVEDFYLPRSITKITSQEKCRIGDALISRRDSCLGTETCEELFTPRAPEIGAGLDGCEVISNGSGSHHEIRKLHIRVELIREATLKSTPTNRIAMVTASFILYASTEFNLPIIKSFIDAPPTTELEPITDSYVQSDEVDMGMSYAELSVYGNLRKRQKLGPYGMWSKLVHVWSDKLSPQEVYDKDDSDPKLPWDWANRKIERSLAAMDDLATKKPDIKRD